MPHPIVMTRWAQNSGTINDNGTSSQSEDCGGLHPEDRGHVRGSVRRAVDEIVTTPGSGDDPTLMLELTKCIWGPDTDAKSGKSMDRPGLKKMTAAASKREFDVLVFWDLSRLSRSGIADVSGLLQQLAGWGVAYRSLQESYLDSLGPFSDVVVALLASIAKLEREKIRERTLAGLARARKQGRIGGRPRADDDAKLVASVQRLRDAGKSIREIAATLDKSPTTIQRLVKAEAA
jgi:DNA invertase Pin-like site-specific DNA recombinase